MKKITNIIVLNLVFILFLYCNSYACKNNQYEVINIVDGDTVDVMDYDKNKLRIRILGVDAYDYRNKRTIKKQIKRTDYNKSYIKNLGKKATIFCIDVLYKECVYLEEDYKDKDIFGRYLRYITINNEDYGTLLLGSNLGNVYCGDKKIKKYKLYNQLSKFKCSDNIITINKLKK